LCASIWLWAKERHVTLADIQHRKPAHLCLREWRRQNAYSERFNRTFREDVLEAYLFSSLEEVCLIVEAWVEEYNGVRPHQAQRGLSPHQFAAQNA
jgi:putative transposase